MKKLMVVLIPLLVLALMFSVTGCCTKTVYVTPTPTPSPTPTPTPTPTPEATPTPTPTPTATPIPSATPPPMDDLAVPCRFHGSVQLNGGPVPAGTKIRAIVQGYVYQTTTPAEGYGPSTYAIVIPKPEGISYEGKTVTFLIGDYNATPSSIWSTAGASTGNILLNISATAP